MKPTVKLAAARTPDGCDLVLYEHDGDFEIRADGRPLMGSRQHESELELARLGCAHLAERHVPRVLIGGLGLGYTLRQALDMLSPRAVVVVAELCGAVVEWNRTYLGRLTAHPLKDKRVTVRREDVVELIFRAEREFDAILLDLDNGPRAVTLPGNSRLYGREGIRACCRALTRKGCLAIWSAQPDKKYERGLMWAGLHVRRFRVPAYKGGKSQSRFVWVAAWDRRLLPAGGGEPRGPAGPIVPRRVHSGRAPSGAGKPGRSRRGVGP
ncbi:MAG: hypothetical protein JXR37_01455 [Kiritimatiellae bacterium]|nr:hypothetical protein [Kiritimatiellia bacterium]